MSVLQELIKQGQYKLERQEWTSKRIEAQQRELAERAKRIVCEMYPGIAEHIVFGEDFGQDAWRSGSYRFLVKAPECEVFLGYVFVDEQGVLCETHPEGEMCAFWGQGNFDMFEDELDIALALAHQAWQKRHDGEAVYVRLEEGA